MAVLETAAAAQVAERQALAQRVATLEAATTAAIAELDALIDPAVAADNG